MTVAEQEVPSSLAALLIASVPLWVLLMRRAAGEPVSRAGVGAVLVGFAGVALLLRPGEQSERRDACSALGACVFAAVMWASGSFASPRLRLPRDPLVSTGWQMLLGGLVIIVAGLAVGEAGDVDLGRVLDPLGGRARLPGRVRLLGRLHRLRVAAAERADLARRHLRVRQPGRGDRARAG